MSEVKESSDEIEGSQSEKGSPEDKKVRSMGRREFLKVFGIGIGSLPIALKAVEKGMYEALETFISSDKAPDLAIDRMNKLSEAVPNSENNQFRPVIDIINEGIAAYENKKSNRVIYRRSEDYRSKEHFAQMLNEASSSWGIKHPQKVIEEFQNAFLGEAREAYIFSNTRTSNFTQLFPPGSGFWHRLKDQFPNIIDDKGNITNHSKFYTAVQEIGKTDMLATKSFVEKKVATDSKPASSSYVLEHFLDKNNGNLAESIYDTAIFLKVMARNDPETGLERTSSINEQWYIKNIRDEFQGPSYINPPEDETVINLIGKPYHSWNLVALLQFFPPEIIQTSGIYRQLITFKDQGLGKTRGDLQTLADLRETEELLLSYTNK